jgi:hypothetical protein
MTVTADSEHMELVGRTAFKKVLQDNQGHVPQ